MYLAVTSAKDFAPSYPIQGVYYIIHTRGTVLI